ncbi:unnamed protein product [Thlaspi arvense]|uniref:Uncharacterized protein n=1 Tax=Thlaspi arvense TaxID=13288 RepID=A0AAU9SY73_THLAR|nr:unnamed protein product [Thlaspi arvense]
MCGSLNEDLLMGRKLKSIEYKYVATRTLKDSISRDIEKEVDHLMRNEYPSPVKPKKRTPTENIRVFCHSSSVTLKNVQKQAKLWDLVKSSITNF